MVTATPLAKHTHKFEVDSKGQAICPCGEVRLYKESTSMKENGVVILKAGDPNYQDSKMLKPVENMTNNITEKLQTETKSSVIDQKAVKVDQNIAKPVPAVNPLTSKPKEVHQIKRWIDENKDLIIHDLETLGVAMTARKWDLSDTGLRNARTRWHQPINKHKSNMQKLHHAQPHKVDSSPLKSEGDLETESLELNLIQHLIKYWRKETEENLGENYELAVNQTIDCLEHLAQIERSRI